MTDFSVAFFSVLFGEKVLASKFRAIGLARFIAPFFTTNLFVLLFVRSNLCQRPVCPLIRHPECRIVLMTSALSL